MHMCYNLIERGYYIWCYYVCIRGDINQLVLFVCQFVSKFLNLNRDRFTVVSHKYAPPPPFCNLSLSTKRRGDLYAGCDNF